jgi:histidinol-phosphate aminotransferase
VAAVERALPGLNLYPDGQSYYLRQAIAEHLGFKIEQVAVGNGADGIILQLCMAYLDEGSEVIVSRSSFPVYDRFARTMRATLVKPPLTADHGLDLKAMAEAITGKTKLIFVCNPNNPTGKIVTAGEVEDFVAQVPDRILIVFDEAYYEFVDSDRYPDTLAYIREGRTNVMTMRTLSKAHGLAGIRLGYAIAAPELLAPLHTVKEPFAVNLLAQVAGIAALQDESFVKRSVTANRAGLDFLYRGFDRLGLRHLESHGNFVLIEIGPQAMAVQQRLLEKGIILRPCIAYDLPEFLRVTVGTEAQNARLIAALEDVLQRI